MDKRWVFPFLFSTTLFIFLLATSFNMGRISSFYTIFSTTASTNNTASVHSHTNSSSSSSSAPPPPSTPLSFVPRLAYFVSGSKGDLDRVWRLLQVIYHPRNQYVVHLDLESPAAERSELASRIANETVFAKVGNVHVVAKANMVTYKGATMVANTLHACAILLKKSKEWDWFINLSASDYPLVTQDDLLHVFATLPRNLNFVEHTGRLGWKETQRAKPLVIDPGLYMTRKSDIFWVTQRRELPNAFKLFTGSAWVALSRDFAEFCIWGWDNLPRTLLMYYTNFLSSPEGYFQTVVCNAETFKRTVVNHDLHYIAWDMPPKQHPNALTAADLPKMVKSGAAFARKFDRGEPVLDRIDSELLGRSNGGGFVPGGWCAGEPPCSEVADPNVVRPGLGAERLGRLVDRIVWSRVFGLGQCK
uniref:Beta-glucuronosyltransferase GlcAT14B n=1 Tax=Ananas comosus var. bracteatus TaxID=296719 RepID=A0A6V7PTA6_ANACO|nr:unnamed protein product [Ananas comosus var. bracteatus]